MCRAIIAGPGGGLASPHGKELGMLLDAPTLLELTKLLAALKCQGSLTLQCSSAGSMSRVGSLTLQCSSSLVGRGALKRQGAYPRGALQRHHQGALTLQGGKELGMLLDAPTTLLDTWYAPRHSNAPRPNAIKVSMAKWPLKAIER